MPIYEYQCQACQHAFETIQSLSEAVLTDCPDCGEAQLKKLVSAAAFRLKGSGWYETDFKSGDKKNVSQSENKSEKKTSESTSKTSSDDKKPAKSESSGNSGGGAKADSKPASS